MLLFGGDHSSRWAGAVVPVAAVLTGGLFGRGGQARSRGSERMLRTLKVSDSKRGLGSRGDIVIYWLLGGSSWPEFEVTVIATGNGNFRAFIFTLHKLCSVPYANTHQGNYLYFIKQSLYTCTILWSQNYWTLNWILFQTRVSKQWTELIIVFKKVTKQQSLSPQQRSAPLQLLFLSCLLSIHWRPCCHHLWND